MSVAVNRYVHDFDKLCSEWRRDLYGTGCVPGSRGPFEPVVAVERTSSRLVGFSANAFFQIVRLYDMCIYHRPLCIPRLRELDSVGTKKASNLWCSQAMFTACQGALR